MLILGLETATPICAVALTREDRLLSESRLNIKNIHAVKLFDLIDGVLENAKIKKAQLDGIAVSIGPGSFTGLRIGLSAAKGIAMGLDLPLMAVPTLQALALSVPFVSGTLAVLLKARKSEYYMMLYENLTQRDEAAGPVEIISEEKLTSRIPKGAVLIGQIEELRENKFIVGDYSLIAESRSLPSALNIAQLGYNMLLNGQIADKQTLEPRYHQQFVAGKPKTVHRVTTE